MEKEKEEDRGGGILKIRYKASEEEEAVVEVEVEYDEDEEDYQEKMNEYIKITLTPRMKPILIYNNNSFNTSTFEIKYKTTVENELHDYDKKWSEITKIVKVEVRRD